MDPFDIERRETGASKAVARELVLAHPVDASRSRPETQRGDWFAGTVLVLAWGAIVLMQSFGG